MVPFLHVTTHVEGHPHDDLLRQMGGTGFPTLLFLDAEGAKVGSPRDRSVASFERCRTALTTIDSVRQRAEAGDEAAAVELLLLEIELRRIESAEFEERVQALEAGASEAHRVQIAAARIDFEVEALVRQTYESDADEARAALVQMLQDGRLPGPDSPEKGMFWYVVYDEVKSSGEPELMRLAAGELRRAFTGGFQLDWAAELERMATGLDERDALQARLDAGEQGLEAKILLVELRLEAITSEVCRARMEAALAVATEAEAAELHQLAVDLEVNELVSAYWRNRGDVSIAERLVELFRAGDPVPGEGPCGLSAGVLASHFNSEATPEEKAAFIARLEELREGAPQLEFVLNLLNR